MCRVKHEIYQTPFRQVFTFFTFSCLSVGVIPDYLYNRPRFFIELIIIFFLSLQTGLGVVNNRKDKQQILIDVSLFLVGAVALTLPSGYMVAPILFVLMGLPGLFNKQTYQLSKEQKLIIFVLLAYFIVQVLRALFDVEFSSRELDLPSRSLCAVIIFLFLIRRKTKFEWLAMGLAVGAILAALITSYQKFILDAARAFSHQMPIQSGNISMTLGLLCLCVMLYYYRLNKTKWVALFSFASFCGILGSLLSGSRGGWVLLPVILFVFYQMHKEYLSSRARTITVICTLGLVAFCFVPQTGIPDRVKQGQQDLDRYLSGQWHGQNADNSLGMRFLLWESAWNSFLDKPVFGWGRNGIRDSQLQQVHEGEITKTVYDFDSHAHNQYLDEMSKRGLVGLAALLAIFFVPLSLFRRTFNQQNTPKEQAIAAMGIMFVLSMMDYCLSQAFFNHNSGSTFYFSCIAVLCGMLFKHRQIADT